MQAPPMVVTRSVVSKPLVGSGPYGATPAHIAKLKQLVVTHSAASAIAKTQLALAQKALANLPAADVEAVVIPGYPPSI